jgi:hypothetical protein
MRHSIAPEPLTLAHVNIITDHDELCLSAAALKYLSHRDTQLAQFPNPGR